jgi:hypothetical protein
MEYKELFNKILDRIDDQKELDHFAKIICKKIVSNCFNEALDEEIKKLKEEVNKND